MSMGAAVTSRTACARRSARTSGCCCPRMCVAASCRSVSHQSTRSSVTHGTCSSSSCMLRYLLAHSVHGGTSEARDVHGGIHFKPSTFYPPIPTETTCWHPLSLLSSSILLPPTPSVPFISIKTQDQYLMLMHMPPPPGSDGMQPPWRKQPQPQLQMCLRCGVNVC